ncbi:MAG: DUF3108 domain-containing protein [Candidatus Nitrohelix vancouverensis]|uniref:DUF3108 domain-containing protein n=1 Tax=Candidatus Nitrohelix vancouverensis TaxID=2705534 RepID=A0A7T0G3T2_9BACT|nr:MAG: DUF3108 domain-containing protein [Candidatus Nitrohelix vancouverensis]
MNKLSVRKFTPLFLLLHFFIGTTALADPLLTAPTDPKPPLRIGEYDGYQASGDIRRFKNEQLLIDISFLWFENAATARVELRENEDGSFTASLEAETKGFVGFFTAYRRHFYQAQFNVVDNGKRFRSRKFVRQVTIGGSVEKTVNFLDYNSRLNKWYKMSDDEVIEKGSREIPEGVQFDDILAAFYNFRNNAYGEIRKDSDYVINTIPEKNTAQFKVHIMNAEEEAALRKLQQRPLQDELALKVIIPPEIFKTTHGELTFWSSKHLIPVETTVEDYILLGDLHAVLKERKILQPVKSLQRQRD